MRARTRVSTGITAAILVLVALTVTPSSAATVEIGSVADRRPNDSGWYREPVTARLWIERAPWETVDTCFTVSSEELPGPIRISAMGPVPRGPVPVERCATEATWAGTKVVVSTLVLRKGDATYRRAVTLRLDDEEPSVGVDPTGAPVTASPVHLEGAASDGFSGPRSITLLFRDALDLREPFSVVATCEGCGSSGPCASEPQPRCGSRVRWTFDGPVAPGRWTVTPAVRDLAGNEAIGDPVDLVVI